MKIIENYKINDINVGKIVRRILKYAPSNSIENLDEILILDKDPEGAAFARYSKDKKRIELFVQDMLGWQPWLLRKTYFFPYLIISITLGHELDHHVRRNAIGIDKESAAESNALNYVYPSFGIFKPLIKLLAFLLRHFRIVVDSR